MKQQLFITIGVLVILAVGSIVFYTSRKPSTPAPATTQQTTPSDTTQNNTVTVTNTPPPSGQVAIEAKDGGTVNVKPFWTTVYPSSTAIPEGAYLLDGDVAIGRTFSIQFVSYHQDFTITLLQTPLGLA